MDTTVRGALAIQPLTLVSFVSFVVDPESAPDSAGLRARENARRTVLSDEHRRRDDRGPQTFLVADRALRDVLGANDLVREPVHFLLLVPALVRIEVETEGGRQHFRRELLRVIAGDVLAL